MNARIHSDRLLDQPKVVIIIESI